MIDVFNGFFKSKRVVVTGHTGFKGSWLSIWLHELGADVCGIGLDPLDYDGCFALSGIGKKIASDCRVDIRDINSVKTILTKFKPEIVFHLAAQPLVRLSYEIPVETWQTNVIGTINIMEAVRETDSVKVVVVVTSDKCYENRNQPTGYKENDPFGGYDPYSSSKGACEIAVQSWRRSFFNPLEWGKKHHVSIATARAGNVIGGGDWAKDRLVPDCIRALQSGRPIEIRNPKSIRPWEYVLEPLSGYMLLAQKMWDDAISYCEGWNFGPEKKDILTVWELASYIVNSFGYGELKDISNRQAPVESDFLMLDIAKAKTRLGWIPKYSAKESIEATVDWYKRYKSENVYVICTKQIEEYSIS